MKTNDFDPDTLNTKNIEQYDGIFKIGDIVEQEFNLQIMKVVGFEPDLIENVITQWEDDMGNIILGKFMESELKIVDK
ncbi:MAG: hypothetical protein V4572_05800 [Bacteroidota bacterium]